jgi:hypothetical protein
MCHFGQDLSLLYSSIGRYYIAVLTIAILTNLPYL